MCQRNLRILLQKDHLQPLLVIAGMDSLQEIGHPGGDDHWEEIFEQTFPAQVKDANKQFTIGEIYNEEGIPPIHSHNNL